MNYPIQIRYHDGRIEHVNSMREIFDRNLTTVDIDKVSFWINNESERVVLSFDRNSATFWYDYDRNRILNVWK